MGGASVSNQDGFLDNGVAALPIRQAPVNRMLVVKAARGVRSTKVIMGAHILLTGTLNSARRLGNTFRNVEEPRPR
jgi:hypothetical protein